MGHKTFGYQPPTNSIVLPPIGSARAAEFIRDVQSFQNLHLNQPVIYHIFRYRPARFHGDGCVTFHCRETESIALAPNRQDSLLESNIQAAARSIGRSSAGVMKQANVCSNAGFLFFGTVLRAIAAADALPLSPRQQLTSNARSLQHNMLQPVKGLILDSAPCRLTPSISARCVL